MMEPTARSHNPNQSITAVPGVLVGHAHDPDALTGVTVVLTPAGAVGGVDVRGGGPGTREIALLDPTANVAEVHGIALCGGSAFGLAAANGVVTWLSEHGYGYATRITRVPIVPAAVIFDLGLGSAERRADEAMGYAACAAATTTTTEGCVGAGMGASVGKLLGIQRAVKSGTGTWSETLPDGTIVGALAVCNAFGDVWRETGGILAGARDEHGAFANSLYLLRQQYILDMLHNPPMPGEQDIENTTIAVIATNARLTKAEATRLAWMAQDALPRAIRPVHTPFDGDTVFTLATGERPRPHLTSLGSVAADVLEHAIRRAVTEATAAGGLPAVRDLS
jgi:L-aminopeptidase/D-esterase-like protein